MQYFYEQLKDDNGTGHVAVIEEDRNKADLVTLEAINQTTVSLKQIDCISILTQMSMENRYMNKKLYLECKDVRDYINWLQRLARNEEENLFTHSYVSETRGKSDKKIPWNCKSLFDAYEQYRWPFSYFDFLLNKKVKGESRNESKTVLDSLELRLHKAIEEGLNEDCYQICIMILDWGGVLGSDKKGNKKKLNGLKSELSEYLTKVKSLFESESVSLTHQYKVIINNQDVPVVMNAGFTKIYSLLCNEFIIYDGRVGAALGLLVRKYCEENHISEVPNNLGFYYGNAKNIKVNRNPSKSPYKFKSLSSSSPVHIRNNLKANWLIQKMFEDNCGEFSLLTHPIRSFESALFMIGYRINR